MRALATRVVVFLLSLGLPIIASAQIFGPRQPFYPTTASEVTAAVTVVDTRYDELVVDRYGRNTTPGTTDMAPAIEAAVAVASAKGGGTVELLATTYGIGSTVEISDAVNGIHIRGAGQAATVLQNNITGAAAPCAILIDAAANYFVLEGFELDGNNLTGASGNGNGICAVNPGVVLAPQHVAIRDVTIRQHRGTGQDETGASIPATGFFGYKSAAFVWDHVFIFECAVGLRLHEMEDSQWFGGVIDDCDDTALWLQDSHAIGFFGGDFQNSGGGDATDGIAYGTDNESITFFGGEFKNGDPYLVNLRGASNVNHNWTFEGVDFRQLDDTMGDTAISVNNAAMNLTVASSRFNFVNTMTSATGIEALQEAGGFSLSGLRVFGNSFKIGTGGTLAQAIHLNVDTNRVTAPYFANNEIGWQDSTGSATAITDGILLEGRVEGALLHSNTCITTANLTITDCYHINSANVLGTQFRGNEYNTLVGGTITNRINNSAGVIYSREERTGGAVLSGSNTWDPASIANGAEEERCVGITGIALGDFVVGVSFSLDVADLELTGAVTAADVACATLANSTGGAVNLGSGTLRVLVKTAQ